jgi:thymidine phosphorylase
MIEWQGGDVTVVDDPTRLPRAREVISVPSPSAGFVGAIDARQVGDAVMELGAGRKVKGEPVDPAVGVVLRAGIGDRIEPGQPLALIHTNGKIPRGQAETMLLEAFEIVPTAPQPVPHVLEVIT